MHYLNTNLHVAAQCYIALVDKNLAAFFAVIHFPHPSCKNFKKGHRLVVLPEYQGLGLGHLLSSEIADHYLKNKNRFIITSNTKALYEQRKKDPRWKITRIGRANVHEGGTTLSNSGSHNRITISYEYVGKMNG